MTFAWDPKKAIANLKKHGVDFREAATVFDDPLSTTFPDEEHSTSERRFVTIGVSVFGSARRCAHRRWPDNSSRQSRQATRGERKFYEED